MFTSLADASFPAQQLSRRLFVGSLPAPSPPAPPPPSWSPPHLDAKVLQAFRLLQTVI